VVQVTGFVGGSQFMIHIYRRYIVHGFSNQLVENGGESPKSI